MKKRLQTLAARAAQESLTEGQMAALEKAKAKQEADGEIENPDPGYLGSYDTYHVGTMKGVGRVYQQTVGDHVEFCVLGYFFGLRGGGL